MNQRAKDGIKQFLEALSVDTEAPELEKTPSRVTELYSELFSGVGLDTKSAWGETFSTDYKGLCGRYRDSVLFHVRAPFITFLWYCRYCVPT